jgi:tricorn protease
MLKIEGISDGMSGYYMFPDIYSDEIIFVTEDDLWKYSGDVCVRLTSDFGILGRGRRG